VLDIHGGPDFDTGVQEFLKVYLGYAPGVGKTFQMQNRTIAEIGSPMHEIRQDKRGVGGPKTKRISGWRFGAFP
jgi:hypothetical protein